MNVIVFLVRGFEGTGWAGGGVFKGGTLVMQAWIKR